MMPSSARLKSRYWIFHEESSAQTQPATKPWSVGNLIQPLSYSFSSPQENPRRLAVALWVCLSLWNSQPTGTDAIGSVQSTIALPGPEYSWNSCFRQSGTKNSTGQKPPPLGSSPPMSLKPTPGVISRIRVAVYCGLYRAKCRVPRRNHQNVRKKV